MPTAEGLAEPLRSRWSPSVFDDEFELGDEQVVTLLRAAQWAPSWGNTQPWRFFVARRGDKTHQVLVEHLSRGNSGWVPRASVVLLTATQVAPDPDGEGGGPHAAYDLGQAAAHITIRPRRWGCTPTSSPASTAPRWPHVSACPATTRCSAGSRWPSGTARRGRRTGPRKEDRVRGRRSLAEFVYADAWGSPWRPE